MRMKTTFAVIALALTTQVATANDPSATTETFTGGSNEGAWSFGLPPTIVPDGGNPGAWLRSGLLDTFTPIGRTQLGSANAFHGDYRAASVNSLGIDLATISNQFPNSCMRPIAVQLVSDPGTPGNVFDDTDVYFTSNELAPCPGVGWKSYDFAVPSSSATLPAGWAVDPGSALPADQIWNTVIQDVDQVNWWYGDPTFFFIFEQWIVGMDNPRISASTTASYCTAGTSASGCQALLSASGQASASAPSGFTVSAAGGEGAKNGIFFYGANGRQANSWGNGTSFQCVTPPVIRTPVQVGGGTSSTCDGTHSIDLNTYFASLPSKNPGAGAVVQTQLWYRDPQNTSNQSTSLSDALEFSVAP